jgi:hypothetical protein
MHVTNDAEPLAVYLFIVAVIWLVYIVCKRRGE